MNIVDQVFERAPRHAVALIEGEQSLSFAELEAAVENAIRVLRAAGLPRREPARVPRIGLACPNSSDHVVLALAVLRAGGCLVPVAGELASPEREAVLRTVDVDALILSDRLPWPERASSANGTGAVRLPGLNATLFPKLTAERRERNGRACFGEAELAAVDPAFIRFSSGTTGEAKGVVLSHATLLARIESASRRLAIGPEDRIVWILSMAHHFAVSIMLYLLKGAATIITASHLAEDVLGDGIRHGGTVLYGSPFHHALLAAEPSGRRWPALRLAVSTAAPLPPATAEAFHRRFGVPLSQGLGLIEVGLPFLNTTAPLEKPGSVGRPCGDAEVRILNLDTGLPAGPCETGELYIRCEGMLDAYLSPWRPREEILAPGGWFRTGDLARFDDSRHLYLMGRVKTVINVAGMKCFPEEVESVLLGCPGVRAVRVRGREHSRFGSVPIAEIVPDREAPAVSRLVAACRASLAAYKIPVDFRFVEDLPKTASGKIRRG